MNGSVAGPDIHKETVVFVVLQSVSGGNAIAYELLTPALRVLREYLIRNLYAKRLDGA